MYDVKLEKTRNYLYCYHCRTKNSLGQTLVIKFKDFHQTEFKRELDYSITFYIATKRKHGYQHLKSTGKDGIKSLIWAKKCIKSFIEDYFNYYHFIPDGSRIIINWTDNKRFKVYYRGLQDLGFKLVNYNNQDTLIYIKSTKLLE